MSSKSVLRLALLVIVFGSLGVYALKKSSSEDVGAPGGATIHATEAAAVVVTYFTTDVRYDSCRTIESLSRESIEGGFPSQLEAGEVVFRVLNTDRGENAHYVDQYELANKTVIVSHQVDGQEVEWADRQDVWLLLDEPDEFFAYVREPVQRYLAKDDA